MISRVVLGASLLIFLSACNDSENKQNETVEGTTPAVIPDLGFELVGTMPHDTTYFTEGLLFHGDTLLESTGSPERLGFARSLIAGTDSTGVSRKVFAELDKSVFFGEGISVLGDKVYQLTYENQKGFVYQLPGFKKVGEFGFSSKEGWGMTTDGHLLIMSDGTDELSYIDPNTFKVIKTLKVRRGELPESYLNELEMVNGFIYANVFTTNTIVKIDTASGQIVGQLDLSRLADDALNVHQGSMEMNGLAFDARSGLFYVTGKFWPVIYKIRLNSL